MSASWASHLHKRNLWMCWKIWRCWAQHASRLQQSYWKSSATQPITDAVHIFKLVSQWHGQKLMTNVWAGGFRQTLQEILDASEATLLLPIWYLETWFCCSLSLSFLSSLAESLSLFHPVCCFLVLSVSLPLNLQSLLCFKCQKFCS